MKGSGILRIIDVDDVDGFDDKLSDWWDYRAPSLQLVNFLSSGSICYQM
ncbi:9123_t:CDS:2, partial [Entrophospora sp. SA101]